MASHGVPAASGAARLPYSIPIRPGRPRGFPLFAPEAICMANVDIQFDPNARQDAERRIYEHLVEAMGLKDGQNAFRDKTPECINSCGFLFGGNCGMDSPPMGVAEKLQVRFRFAERERLMEAFDRMCNGLPMKGDGRVIYAGFRCEFGYERPDVVDVVVDLGNGKMVTVWAADVELRAVFGLMRSGQ